MSDQTDKLRPVTEAEAYALIEAHYARKAAAEARAAEALEKDRRIDALQLSDGQKTYAKAIVLPCQRLTDGSYTPQGNQVTFSTEQIVGR
jgi:hypothetical protein